MLPRESTHCPAKHTREIDAEEAPPVVAPSPQVISTVTIHTKKPVTATDTPKSTMASNNTPHWEAPKFSFTVQNQAKEWKLFYTRAVNLLLDIRHRP